MWSQVVINSITAGSVIVNTTAITTNASAPDVTTAAASGFNETLPADTFGQPTVTDISVTPVSAASVSSQPPTPTEAPVTTQAGVPHLL